MPTAPAASPPGAIERALAFVVAFFTTGNLVAKVPLTPNLSVLARIGAAYAKTQDSFTSTGLVAGDGTSTSERDTKIKVGAGVQYALSPSMLLRTEVERYRISDGAGAHGHVNLLSVGLVFPFKGY